MSYLFNSLVYTLLVMTPILSVVYNKSFSKSNIRLFLAISTVMVTLSLAFVLVVFFGQRWFLSFIQGFIEDIDGFYLQMDTRSIMYGYLLFAVWVYAFYMFHQRYSELADE